MYTINNEDKFIVGSQHFMVEHDCSLKEDGFCPLFTNLLEGYAKAMDSLLERDIQEVLETE
jgi:hypothetical protein